MCPGRAAGSDCSLAGAGTTHTFGPRIQLWEAGFCLPDSASEESHGQGKTFGCHFLCPVLLSLVPPHRELWGKAACVSRFLERHKPVLCECSTAHPGLAPREDGTEVVRCPMSPRRVRGQEALRNNGMRDPSSHPTSWVSNLAQQPVLSAGWPLSVCPCVLCGLPGG